MSTTTASTAPAASAVPAGPAGPAAPIVPAASGGRAGSATAAGEGAAAGATGAADQVVVIGSLSPSRASDFMTCPLRYRFRVVDKIEEPPTPAATRGTVVHGVLERLFDLAPAQRTPAAAGALLAPVWTEALAADPRLGEMFEDAHALDVWLESARELLAGYFALEDPRRLAPAARELYVEHVLPTGLRLRGYLDRLDEAPAPPAGPAGAEPAGAEPTRTEPPGAALRVVDYKTGRSPRPPFGEASALFQMKFYAVLLWRTRGVIPRELRLYYLGDRVWLRYQPDEADLLATERKLTALWAAIERAHRTGDWRASPSRLCDWCDHKVRCPAFGGTPPPLPTADAPAPVDDAPPTVCEADG